MENNKLKLFFAIVTLFAVLSACGTNQLPSSTNTPNLPNSTNTPNLPTPTPYDTQASSDDKKRLDFFRQGGTWTFLPHSPDEIEWFVLILAKESALAGKELKLGSASIPGLDMTDAGFLVSRLISPEQEKARITFFRLYADGIDQGDFDAFLVKTTPIDSGASVPISNAISLSKQEFLDVVIPK